MGSKRCVHSCLVSHLKFIKFQGFQGLQDELFIKYAFRNGMVLETMIVSDISLDQKKCQIMKRLSNVRRACGMCQLKFARAVSPKVIHHLLSLVAVAYSMLSGEGQLYTYMVLISETTTPGVNLRWYLDVAGMKRSKVYLINGVVIFIGWLVARILLFVYMFYHAYLHFDQVQQMHTFGQILVVVPVVLSVMNLSWATCFLDLYNPEVDYDVDDEA
ncbi:TLC domain-containing protein 4-B-like isoform X2 [Trifolium pratense]|nr:TLC domain-containing protein 4-B-like isoform X2 [Trifolium pratense]XP_045791347.1 TLC domain-containing protein 4-B-like isoform X2 [Trifolium pratense]XP_045791350.1 TLC domain-containing protein 4-B-like isoform X2 [Trifolium pratense]